jgi:hypothetical protein
VYDYSTVAIGPLACNMNLGVQGTVKPMVDHVGRCLSTRQLRITFGETLDGSWHPGSSPLGTRPEGTGVTIAM